MDLITLANKLDIEFKIQTNEENLNDFAVTIENRKYHCCPVIENFCNS